MKPTRDQIVDLSHRLLRRRDNYEYEAKLDPTSRTGPRDERFDPFDAPFDEKAWYIEGIAHIAGKAGTHVKVPYTCDIRGTDTMRYPTERLIGECYTIDCSGKHPGEEIKLADVKKAEGKIEPGDIVFIYTGMDENYRTPRWRDWIPFEPAALEWLLDQGIKAIGTDGPSIEYLGGLGKFPSTVRTEATGEPAQHACFDRGVAIVESLANLKQIVDERVTVFILALPMEEMPASPVRVVAIRG